MTRRSHRSTATLAALMLATSLIAAGCGTDEETVPEAEPNAPVDEPAPETDEPMATSEEPTDDAMATSEEPTDDAMATSEEPTGAAPGGGEVAPPGTEVAIGESAVTHVQALQERDEFYGFAVLETTVTSIEAGDEDYFAQFENSEELEGLVPYFITAEHEIISFEGEPNANMVPLLTGVLENGQDATSLVGFSGLGAECPLELYPEQEPGAVATVCKVAVGDVGGPAVTSVTWTGDDLIDGVGDENPYMEDPVVWSK